MSREKDNGRLFHDQIILYGFDPFDAAGDFTRTFLFGCRGTGQKGGDQHQKHKIADNDISLFHSGYSIPHLRGGLLATSGDYPNHKLRAISSHFPCH